MYYTYLFSWPVCPHRLDKSPSTESISFFNLVFSSKSFQHKIGAEAMCHYTENYEGMIITHASLPVVPLPWQDCFLAGYHLFFHFWAQRLVPREDQGQVVCILTPDFKRLSLPPRKEQKRKKKCHRGLKTKQNPFTNVTESVDMFWSTNVWK